MSDYPVSYFKIIIRYKKVRTGKSMLIKFEIKGKGKETNRKRKRIYYANTKDEAIKKAEDDGTIVEKITELPHDPPLPPEPATEKQIKYATHLGIKIPNDATKEDLSYLIDIKVNNDKPATDRHKEFAHVYGLEPSKYIGKKALFNYIFNTLSEPGREKELITWFLFRVYRTLVSGKHNVPITTPTDPALQEISKGIYLDEKIVNSIRRYYGEQLVFFGEFTADNGRVYTGGSMRTIAYKTACQKLREKLNLPKRASKRATVQTTESNKTTDSKKLEIADHIVNIIKIIVFVFIFYVVIKSCC